MGHAHGPLSAQSARYADGQCVNRHGGCFTPDAHGILGPTPQKTSGRLRRALQQVDFSELALCEARIRKKAAVTAHLPRGNPQHTGSKALIEP